MGAIKEMIEPVPWHLQDIETLWEEDDCCRDGPSLQEEWVRRFGAELPDASEVSERWDVILHYVGGDVGYGWGPEGAFIFQLRGGPTLADLHELTEQLQDSCEMLYGRSLTYVRHIQRRVLLNGVDHPAKRLFDSLRVTDLLRWIHRRELPGPYSPEGPGDGDDALIIDLSAPGAMTLARLNRD